MRVATTLVAVAAGCGALAAPAGATFGGADGRISFDRDAPPGPQGNIWSIGGEGGETALLQGGPRTQSDASWSPDGRRLAFQLQTTARDEGPTEIAVMNADGSGTQHITRLRSSSIAPSWTPDGRILFVSDYESKRGYHGGPHTPPPPHWTYAVNANGLGIQRLV